MHYSVLLNESLDLLAVRPDGVYVDGTFGRGGHSREILARLNDSGRLIAIDQDPEAIKYAKTAFDDKRFTVIHDAFANVKKILLQLGITSIDGALFDLGVSSPQLDSINRGFSFRFDAPLDMRMDNTTGITASQWLQKASIEEMAEVFWRYGEERFSRRIAAAIVKARAEKPITTTFELAGLIEDQIPFKERGKHPGTRVFQAIRIHINNELWQLEQILEEVPFLLGQNGRLVIISFHSLEDRLVKLKFNQLVKGEELPKWAMVADNNPEFAVVAKKIKAGSDELNENNRSRSAIMRCLERVRNG